MSEPAATSTARATRRRSAPVSNRRLSLVPRGAYEAPKAPFVALVVGLLVAALVILLVLNTQIARNSFTVAKLQARNTALNEQQGTLQQQVDADSAPNTLSARASKLGMVPAGVPAFIRLPDGKVLGSPSPAARPVPIRIKGVGLCCNPDGSLKKSAHQNASPKPSASPDASPASSLGGQQVTPNLGGH